MDEGGQESTSVSVQAAAKHSKGNKNGPALPVFNADASKVTIKGMGIKKAFVGKQNSFSVNASEAGVFYDYALLPPPLVQMGSKGIRLLRNSSK